MASPSTTVNANIPPAGYTPPVNQVQTTTTGNGAAKTITQPLPASPTGYSYNPTANTFNSPGDATHEPTVISSQNGQSVLQQHIDNHTNDMAAISGQNTPPASGSTTPTKTDPNTSWAMKQVGGVTAEEAKGAGLDLKDYSYDQTSGYFLPNAGSQATQDKFRGDKLAIDKSFESQLIGLNTASNSLINSINSIYADRMNAEKDVNARELQGFNTMGIRNGGTRYAGEVQQGILTADERVGLDRLQSIAHEQASALASATEALQNKQYTQFIDHRNAIDKLTQERDATLKDLQTKAIAAQKEQNLKITTAKNESSIAALMEKGVTDPAQILTQLNSGGSTLSAKDVKNAMTSLAPTDNLKDLSGEVKNFYVLQQKGLLPATITSLPKGQQLMAYLKQEKAATTLFNSSGGKNPVTFPPPSTSDVHDTTTLFHQPGVLGADGYIEPTVYKQAYDWWVNTQHYSPQEFIKSFPPKDYINPRDNPSLPSYLQTSAKAPTASDSTYRKPPAAIIGSVRALKDKKASQEEINSFIKYSGYNPADAAFQ